MPSSSSGTREYREGDPIRNIHWRSWARRGEPVVKEYQEEYFCRIAHRARHVPARGGPRRRTSGAFEAAISVVASIADYFSRSEYIVDILAAGPDVYEVSAGPQPGLPGQHPRRAGLPRALPRPAVRTTIGPAAVRSAGAASRPWWPCCRTGMSRARRFLRQVRALGTGGPRASSCTRGRPRVPGRRRGTSWATVSQWKWPTWRGPSPRRRRGSGMSGRPAFAQACLAALAAAALPSFARRPSRPGAPRFSSCPWRSPWPGGCQVPSALLVAFRCWSDWPWRRLRPGVGPVSLPGDAGPAAGLFRTVNGLVLAGFLATCVLATPVWTPAWAPCLRGCAARLSSLDPTPACSPATSPRRPRCSRTWPSAPPPGGPPAGLRSRRPRRRLATLVFGVAAWRSRLLSAGCCPGRSPRWRRPRRGS